MRQAQLSKYLRNVTIAPGTHSRKAGEPRPSRAKISFNFLRGLLWAVFYPQWLGGAEATRGCSITSTDSREDFFFLKDSVRG